MTSLVPGSCVAAGAEEPGLPTGAADMEGRSGSQRPGTRAGSNPVPTPHGVPQTGAPPKIRVKESAVASEPQLVLAPAGLGSTMPPSPEGPRLALASPHPLLVPSPAPSGQETVPGPCSSGLSPGSLGHLVVAAPATGPIPAPTSLGQLVVSASAGPRPPLAKQGAGLAAVARDQKQVTPGCTGPKPALAASGLSLALTQAEHPLPPPPASAPPAPSPLSPAGEQTPAAITPLPAGRGATPTPRHIPPSEGCLQPLEQASPVGSPPSIQMPPDPRVSPSFRARPEVPRGSPEHSAFPRPPQSLPLEGSQGLPEPGARSPVLLSPTFRPGASSPQTVPPALPKPPRSPSRSPSRPPCVPPPPEKVPPRPSMQVAGPSTHPGPGPQSREAPTTPAEPSTSSASSTPSSSSWSAQATCKNDPGFWITVVTWNVGTAMPPDDVASLLHLGHGGESQDADLVAIGLQEVNSVLSKRLKDALFTDQWSELFMDALAPFHFVLVSTVRMQGVILLLFAKYFHLPFLRDVQTDCTRTGLGGYWGNKGGVSVRLAAFGHMLCFLNCHLPAHMDKAEQRKDDFRTILSLQQFAGPGAPGILDHDLVFWFGDLNFRIENYDLRFVKSAIDGDRLQQLWEKDQLNMAKNTWPILKGFQEGPLNFAPTFKFDVGTNKYDTSAKKRKPAWTDRILWKVKTPAGGPSPSGRERHRLQVTQHSYRSHMEYTVSDHKPVAARFVLRFAYRDDVPLVRLEVADEWTRPEQAVARYRVETAFARSSWDWIGLYRVGFRHFKDYVAYVWAKHEDADGSAYQVTFSEESLPRGHGDFILGYYSHSLSMLIGVTEPFQISLPTSEAAGSSSDSSGGSSEDEDDSTLELLAPKSRSPSPGKSKRHRSRSPGLARFPSLALRPSSRERRGASRSPSPQSRHVPRVPSEKGRDAGGQRGHQEGPPGLPGAWAFPPSAPQGLRLLPALRLETADPGGGSSQRADSQVPTPSSLSPSPQGQQRLEEGSLGP